MACKKHWGQALQNYTILSRAHCKTYISSLKVNYDHKVEKRIKYVKVE